MGRLRVITTDHNSSTVRERSGLAGSEDIIADFCSRGLISEYVVLATCNRYELYMILSGSGHEKETIAAISTPGSRTLSDYEAARHLLRVLLGLESMAKGESHIVSQVKDAYKSADRCGKVLHRLFQRAIGISAALRSSYHPGREPSIPYIAARHYAKNPGTRPGLPVLVVGLGMMGTVTGYILMKMGFDVLVANRSERERDKKIAGAEFVRWDEWKQRARECGAVFLCTASDVPLLSAEEQDAMPGVWVLDMGSPHQSEPRSSGVRVTLDEMNAVASEMTADYGKLLAELEEEADKASGVLLAEISILTDDTWKQLALARAHSIVRERAASYSGKTGASPEALEMFASSVLKAFLHPLVSAKAAHGARAWKILSGEDEED